MPSDCTGFRVYLMNSLNANFVDTTLAFGSALMNTDISFSAIYTISNKNLVVTCTWGISGTVSQTISCSTNTFKNSNGSNNYFAARQFYIGRDYRQDGTFSQIIIKNIYIKVVGYLVKNYLPNETGFYESVGNK